MKRYMAPLGLETRVIAAIVINPKGEKNPGDEKTVDDRGGDEIHAERGVIRNAGNGEREG